MDQYALICDGLAKIIGNISQIGIEIRLNMVVGHPAEQIVLVVR